MGPYQMRSSPQGAEAVLEAAVEVRRTAWLAASGHVSLDAVIDGLSDVFPYDEILLSRWNPDAQEHLNVISSAAASAAEFIQFEQHRDPLVAHMRQTRQTLWLSRLTAEQRQGSTTVQKVITPLGFAEGTTQCLYSTEGHYVGVVKEHPSGWTAMTHKGAYAGLYPTKQAAAEVLVKQAGYELGEL